MKIHSLIIVFLVTVVCYAQPPPEVPLRPRASPHKPRPIAIYDTVPQPSRIAPNKPPPKTKPNTEKLALPIIDSEPVDRINVPTQKKSIQTQPGKPLDELPGASNTKQGAESTSTKELQRAIKYEIALNLFNALPKKGIPYMKQNGFLKPSNSDLAVFLMKRNGLSKETIGEYLMRYSDDSTLKAFLDQFDFKGKDVEQALREFLAYFLLKGDNKEIQRIVEFFSQRYCDCNSAESTNSKCPKTTQSLTDLILQLNNDLHSSKNIFPLTKMTLKEFQKKVRELGAGSAMDEMAVMNMYNRIKENAIKPNPDHSSEVIKMKNEITGGKSIEALPHRKFIKKFKLKVMMNLSDKERSPRLVYVFNDLLVVTKETKGKPIFEASYHLKDIGVQMQENQNSVDAVGLVIRDQGGEKPSLFLLDDEKDGTAKFFKELKYYIEITNTFEALRLKPHLYEESDKERTRNNIAMFAGIPPRTG